MLTPGLIDTHAHFLTEDYVAAAVAAGMQVPDQMPGWPTWDPREHLDLMRRAGIERSILSISSPGVHFGSADAAIALAKSVNDHAAEVARTYPDRFGFFASLPLPAVADAVSEARRALDVLGAAGFCLMSNAGGVYLGDPSHEPLWELLNNRHAVVFVHPTAPPHAAELSPDRPFPMIEFVFDEARTMVDLLFAGVFDRYPDIRFVVSHSGGALPVLLERIDLFYSGADLGGAVRPHSLYDTVRRLWFDCAGTPLPYALPALERVVGTEHLLYGSDYCFMRPPAVLAHVERLTDEAPSSLDRMAENGRRLFGLAEVSPANNQN